MKSHGSGAHGGHRAYYQRDKNFMDVAEAEEHGILPGLKNQGATSVRKMWNTVMGEDSEAAKDMATCEKSITYVLETEDAGLGSTLMGLWLSLRLGAEGGSSFLHRRHQLVGYLRRSPRPDNHTDIPPGHTANT